MLDGNVRAIQLYTALLTGKGEKESLSQVRYVRTGCCQVLHR